MVGLPYAILACANSFINGKNFFAYRKAIFFSSYSFKTSSVVVGILYQSLSIKSKLQNFPLLALFQCFATFTHIDASFREVRVDVFILSSQLHQVQTISIESGKSSFIACFDFR